MLEVLWECWTENINKFTKFLFKTFYFFIFFMIKEIKNENFELAFILVLCFIALTIIGVEIKLARNYPTKKDTGLQDLEEEF